MASQISGEESRAVLSGAAANTTVVIPGGYAIRDIFMRNTTANAITGGVRIGTTDGGVDVVVALTIGASAFVSVAPAALLLRQFSPTVAQTLFVQAVIAWNSASLDIVITMDRCIP